MRSTDWSASSDMSAEDFVVIAARLVPSRTSRGDAETSPASTASVRAADFRPPCGTRSEGLSRKGDRVLDLLKRVGESAPADPPQPGVQLDRPSDVAV